MEHMLPSETLLKNSVAHNLHATHMNARTLKTHTTLTIAVSTIFGRPTN